MRVLTILAGFVLSAGLGVQAQPPAGGPGAAHDMKTMTPLVITKAVAVLTPTPASKVEGTVTFQATDSGIRVVVDVIGLTPGKHGFHIHEFGDCSAPDFASAGPHFMAPGQSHGSPSDSLSHEGDMGNLVADSTGHAHAEWIDSRLSFVGAGSILGRGVIIHENEDDLKTQPTGNSGARLACGTIGISKP